MSEFGSDETISGAEGDTLSEDDHYVKGKVIARAGVQSRAVKVTATADGLTTGLIPRDASFVSVTAGGDANAIITLPAGDADLVGMSIRGAIGATGCEIRTPDASGATINNLDSDGTKEYALPANTTFWAQLVAANTWIVMHWTNLGAVAAAVVPD